MDLKPFLQNKWLLILGVLGVFCLVFPSLWSHNHSPARTTIASGQTEPSSTTGSATGNATDDPTAAYEAAYDRKLTDILAQISGVNDVSVMVSLDSTKSLKLATNTQQTKQTQSTGGASSSESTTENEDVFTQKNSDGSSTPYVVESAAPKARGVLVVVDAEDFYVAKAEIIDAITNVLDVPAYKISVEPKKSKS